MRISRREFIGTAAAAGLASGAAAMPTRVLGKTGVRISILAFGSGSRFLQFPSDEEGAAAVKRALDLGVNYIDTADDYGKDHLSERRIAMGIQGRREQVFLATKMTNRDGAESERIVTASLKALAVDRLDLLHIHALTTADDLAKIEEKGGVLEQVLKLREQKMVRFIGISCHADPAVLKTALERHDFDCTQMALNAGTVSMKGGKGGMVVDPAVHASFETLALPVAVRKKMGILAMKVFAQDGLTGQAPIEKLLYYTLSLPVSAAVVGFTKVEQLEENARLAKSFQPLPASEMRELSERLSSKNKLALDRFFRNHLDC